MTHKILTVSSQSKERLKVAVYATEAGVQVDPTLGTNRFAFLTVGADPTAGTTWFNGDWETITGPPLTYKARILIGPGSTVGALNEGNYDVWIRVTHATEDAMRKVASLIVL